MAGKHPKVRFFIVSAGCVNRDVLPCCLGERFDCDVTIQATEVKSIAVSHPVRSLVRYS